MNTIVNPSQPRSEKPFKLLPCLVNTCHSGSAASTFCLSLIGLFEQITDKHKRSRRASKKWHGLRMHQAIFIAVYKKMYLGLVKTLSPARTLKLVDPPTSRLHHRFGHRLSLLFSLFLLSLSSDVLFSFSILLFLSLFFFSSWVCFCQTDFTFFSVRTALFGVRSCLVGCDSRCSA